ncbi:MAG: cytochrome c [Verrucomicrobia bacterium]|nr:cytochrome c [Verrucomicrobiota bacterium]
MRNVYLALVFVCVLLVSIFGFRGTKFTSPPIEVFPEWAFPGMKLQPKLRPQAESKFFADGRADRAPVEHTVMRGMLREDDHLNRGKDATGAFARGFPAGVTVDLKFIERGQDRYTIYCLPCHGMVGDGNVSIEDRWAVVAYVRALQRAQQGSAADVTDAAAKQTLGLK